MEPILSPKIKAFVYLFDVHALLFEWTASVSWFQSAHLTGFLGVTTSGASLLITGVFFGIVQFTIYYKTSILFILDFSFSVLKFSFKRDIC